jgi:hypothetical protein
MYTTSVRQKKTSSMMISQNGSSALGRQPARQKRQRQQLQPQQQPELRTGRLQRAATWTIRSPRMSLVTPRRGRLGRRALLQRLLAVQLEQALGREQVRPIQSCRACCRVHCAGPH